MFTHTAALFIRDEMILCVCGEKFENDLIAVTPSHIDAFQRHLKYYNRRGVMG